MSIDLRKYEEDIKHAEMNLGGITNDTYKTFTNNLSLKLELEHIKALNENSNSNEKISKTGLLLNIVIVVCTIINSVLEVIKLITNRG